ncbi:NifB/NifX family molybdenum-iron cluster-binding protein [bacterium AH-315-L21]|nr:NifB/NifX family molybdenum-iron cluster-binding protein [bacterium AH-315-L21]
MTIAVSSTEKSMSGTADLRFGRCKYFAVYNTLTKECTFVENEAINSNQGAGIAASQTVAGLKAEVVLTGNLGPKALNVLNAAGINGYKIGQTTIENAISAFQEKKLSQITEPGRPQK